MKGCGLVHEELKQIPARIRELREILNIGVSDMARMVDVPLETYEKYESGEQDIPISMLYKIAAVLHTDMTVLITGDSPHMEQASVVRAGTGVDVERFPGYDFSSLAYNFKGRVMEPLLVNIDPSNETPPLAVHGGQEFNYVLKGTVKVAVGSREYVLNEGDCIYFDPQLPHSQTAVGAPATFLTVIQE